MCFSLYIEKNGEKIDPKKHKEVEKPFTFFFKGGEILVKEGQNFEFFTRKRVKVEGNRPNPAKIYRFCAKLTINDDVFQYWLTPEGEYDTFGPEPTEDDAC